MLYGVSEGMWDVSDVLDVDAWNVTCFKSRMFGV